jgi:voltage-gated potassium channel
LRDGSDPFSGGKNWKIKLKKLGGHYIVCGYGRIGRLLTQYLVQKYINVVVIERNRRHETKLDGDGVLYMIGEAADKNELIRAV